MAVNWKAILSLFIIFAIIGLLIFTPRGQKIVGNKTMPVGSFLKSFTGKLTKVPTNTGSKRLDIFITNVNPSSLGDTEISIKGEKIQAKLDYEIITLLESNINFDQREVEVETGRLIGKVNFFRNGNMRVSGNTDNLKLNDMTINKPDIDFLTVGRPIDYDLGNIEKDELMFSYLSGLLKCSQLTGGNLLLNNDQLELVNFNGYIRQVNNSVTIGGSVDKMILNGVDISK
jgi:hypothetical protein